MTTIINANEVVVPVIQRKKKRSPNERGRRGEQCV